MSWGIPTGYITSDINAFEPLSGELYSIDSMPPLHFCHELLKLLMLRRSQVQIVTLFSNTAKQVHGINCIIDDRYHHLYRWVIVSEEIIYSIYRLYQSVIFNGCPELMQPVCSFDGMPQK